MRHAPTPTAPARGHNDQEVAALLDVFRHIADRWALSVEQRCALLGGIGRTTHYDWMVTRRLPKELSRYQREAILHVVAIDLAILAYVGSPDALSGTGTTDASPNAATPAEPPLADRYVLLPGSAPDGESRAIDVMLSGITGLAQVRHALEARNGASPVATLVALGALPEVGIAQSAFPR